MGYEIERKYLLHQLPDQRIASGELIVRSKKHLYQTYLAFAGDQEMRVRKLVDLLDQTTSFTYTFKRGNGLRREEIEFPISEAIYDQLLSDSRKIPLEKVRTTMEDHGLSFDIDEYKTVDLITVEVEFVSESDANSFTPPEWFGDEIGSEAEYRNKTLWLNLQRGV